MPFLPPNQQRQSIEGTAELHSSFLLGGNIWKQVNNEMHKNNCSAVQQV